MPYHIVKHGDKFCVEKRDGSKKLGCHPTQQEAVAQLGALYAHEPKAAATTRMTKYVVRELMVEGRKTLVVPVVALVEGVVHASNADNPEFVGAHVLSENLLGWEGKPIFHGHPIVDGRPVSGTTPGVAETALGVVRNPRMIDKRLLMDAYLDDENTLQHAPELHARVKALEPIEVSVGVFTHTDDTVGEHNGRAYRGAWGPMKQDHLAILPRHERGACNYEMGCGLRAATEGMEFEVLYSADQDRDQKGMFAGGATRSANKASAVANATNRASDHAAAAKAHKDAAAAHTAAAKEGSQPYHQHQAQHHMNQSMAHAHKASSPAARMTPPRKSISVYSEAVIPESQNRDLYRLIREAIRKKDDLALPPDRVTATDVVYRTYNGPAGATGHITYMQRTYARVGDEIALGDPIAVEPFTAYEPIGAEVLPAVEGMAATPKGKITIEITVAEEADMKHSYAEWLTDGKETLELLKTLRNISAEERDKLPAGDFAGKNRSFPIAIPGDVHDAASSIGRAGGDNYSTDELKRRIIAIAYRKGASFVAQLPDDWKKKKDQKNATVFARVMSMVRGEVSDETFESVAATLGEELFDDDAASGAPCSCHDKRAQEHRNMTKEQIAKFLETATDAQLKALAAATEAKEPTAEELKAAAEKKAADDKAATEAEEAKIKTAAEALAKQDVKTQVDAAIKALTFEDMLSKADPAVRESIQSGQRIATARKEATIKALKDTGKCKFSDEELKAMTQGSLDTLLELAGTPRVATDFSGQGMPRPGSNDEPKTAPKVPSLQEKILASRKK